jgi:type II secretory pathway component GspD/PulD (secretin)
MLARWFRMAVAGIALALVAIFGTLRASADDVRLDLGDTVELKVVVNSVAAKLGLNLIYDDALLNKKVSLRLAAPVAKDQLLDLLRMVLRSRGLALISAEQPGWLKIVSADQLASETTGLARFDDQFNCGHLDLSC